MKFFRATLVIVSLLVGSGRCFSQGFLNLNFEQATVASAPSGYTPSDAYDPISAAEALPGWSVYEDATLCTAIWGEPAALDKISVALNPSLFNPFLIS